MIKHLILGFFSRLYSESLHLKESVSHLFQFCGKELVFRFSWEFFCQGFLSIMGLFSHVLILERRNSFLNVHHLNNHS